MANTLVAPADLADFPGAPFVDALVDAAAGSVRDEAGWHIAPSVTETLTVVSPGGTALLIPSLLYTITAVRDVTDAANPETITNYVDRGSGVLHRGYGWATDHKYEVDVTHGYAACPPALLPVLAELCQLMGVNSALSQQSAGPFRIVIREGGLTETSATTLARFKV